jgi:regulatory protein
MDALARREHGRVELARKLTDRGHPPDVVAATLDRLAGERLLDDGRYAEAFVSSRIGRGQGPVRILAELRARGVADAVAEEAVAAAGVDWIRLAGEVRRRRFGGRASGDFRERAKQARFLQYRGFTAEQAMAALGQAADGNMDEDVAWDADERTDHD